MNISFSRLYDYFGALLSSETVNLCLPLFLLLLNTFLPSTVLIRMRNPCFLYLFVLLGWNVLFI
jgi:hypothetical protein